MAVVSAPLFLSVFLTNSRRFGGVGGRIVRGFVVGGGMRPVAWPIIVVPFNIIPSP